MAHPRMVDSYLRELLEDGFEEVTPAREGGYEVPGEPRVRLLVTGSGPSLRVLAIAVLAEEVEPTPQLLARINDINAGLPYGRLFVHDGEVVVEESIQGDSLSETLLDHAVAFTRWAANTHAAAFRPDETAVADGASPADGAPATAQPTEPASAVVGAAPSTSAADAPDTPSMTVGPRPSVNAAGYL